MTMVYAQCLTCVHFNADYAFTCAAFPAGIPDSVLLNQQDHRNAISNDKGVRWEPREKADVHPLQT